MCGSRVTGKLSAPSHSFLFALAARGPSRGVRAWQRLCRGAVRHQPEQAASSEAEGSGPGLSCVQGPTLTLPQAGLPFLITDPENRAHGPPRSSGL